MLKSIILLNTVLLILHFNSSAQNKNFNKTIETKSLTTFTFNYQKGKYDKGITKKKQFNFDIVKRGHNAFITRTKGNKKKEHAMIRVQKKNCEFGKHDSFYSHKLKTTICLKDRNVIVHFAEHFDKPAEVRVYSKEQQENDLIHPLTISK